MTIGKLAMLVAKERCSGPCAECIRIARLEIHKLISKARVEQPQRESEPNVAAMREALEFAKGAIMDAIGLEDGLDGAAGTAVIGMIDKALTGQRERESSRSRRYGRPLSGSFVTLNTKLLSR